MHKIRMKYILPFIVTILIVSQNSFSETIKSKTVNNTGQVTESIRLGNNPKIVKLKSGKKIKLISIGPFYFKNGDPPALVLNYETKIELSNYTDLKSEVDEIWESFRHNVEESDFKTAAIRARRSLKGNDIRTAKGRGFVFLKQEDGSWKPIK